MEEVPAGETEVEAGVDVDKILKNYDLEGKELDASAFDLGEYEDVLKEAGVEDAQDKEGVHADQEEDRGEEGEEDKADDQDKEEDRGKEGGQDKQDHQDTDHQKTDHQNTNHQDNKPSDDTTPSSQFLVCSHTTTPFAPLPHSFHLQIYRNAQRLSSVPNPLHCLPLPGDQ